jgi:hypothetical protein
MTTTSQKFEKQIRRIHSLVEQAGSEVTWNDKIPDPDNLAQSRQIDVSIKRDGKFTLVECRIHQSPQDVKWIEELIGRRLSLHADAIIAVSNSGFTEGAKLKARHYGIILRDLKTLSEQEIQAWGFSTRVSLTFFEYQNVDITLRIIPTEKTRPTIADVVSDLKKTETLYRIFDIASNALDDRGLLGKRRHFRCDLKVEGLSVCGANIDQIEFASYISKIIHEVTIPSIVAYDAPDVETTERSVHIEKVALGDFEITQSSDRVFVAADLTPIKCPPNSQFKYIEFHFGRDVSIESFELLGLPKFEIPIQKIKLRLSILVQS